MPVMLQREAPNKGSEEFPWDEETKKRFGLDKSDLMRLEDGGIVWDGDVAFSLSECEDD